jgi:hypothetical protein
LHLVSNLEMPLLFLLPLVLLILPFIIPPYIPQIL